MADISKKQYSKMVGKYSPPSPIVSNTVKAFLVGGFICTMGQFFKNMYLKFGLDKETSATAVSITLILIAAVLTALNVFDKIAKQAGAGTLVPITGFSNAVVSPAMEFLTEGFVTGTASKMFVVAGPVIVYGTVSSIIAGFIYWIMR